MADVDRVSAGRSMCASLLLNVISIKLPTQTQPLDLLSKVIRQHHSLPSICSSPNISCCSTILYTLAFNSVKTVAVFLSSPRSASKISMEGFAASSARTVESYIAEGHIVSLGINRLEAEEEIAHIVKVSSECGIFIQH